MKGVPGMLMLLAFISQNACALNLGQAFHALIAHSRGGIYQSQVRGYAMAPGFNVRVPSQNVQLVSVTPPSYSAGCNGIDLFMGGMSYISGQQFVSLLKGIAANAMGYSFSLAMRTLCPVCSTVVSDLQHVAQSANSMAVHQCQFAMGLMNTATGMQATTRLRQQAALTGASSGLVGDFLSGLSTIGEDVTKALDIIEQKIAHISSVAGRAQMAQETHLGSDTWQLLSGLDRVQRIFLHSLLGTTVRYPYPSKHPNSIVVEPIGASMRMQQLADLLMYGVLSKTPNNSAIVVNVCTSGGRYQQHWLKDADKNLCLSVTKQRLQDTTWYKKMDASIHGLSIADYGFFGLSYALMGQAIENIAHKKALGTPASVRLPSDIYGGRVSLPVAFSAEEIQAFISMAPVPLYRAMNIAAVHPGVAQAMMHNIAEMIAAHYTMQYIQEKIMNITQSGNQATGHIGIAPEQLTNLEKTLRTMHYRLQSSVKLMMSQLGAKQAWMHQLGQIQSQIHAEAWENGLNQVISSSQ